MGAQGNSIVAFLGLNKSNFTKPLQDSVKEADAAGKAMAASSNKTTGIQIANAGRVKKQISGLAESLLSGADATDLLAQSAIHLGNSLKLGLGGAVAIGVGAVLAKKLIDSSRELDDLEKKFREFGKQGLNVNFATLDELKKRLSDSTAKAEELRKALHSNFATIQQSLGKAITDPLGDNSFDDIKARKQADLNKSIAEQQKNIGQIAAKENRLIDIEQARAQYGERTADLLKIQAEFEEKIGNIKRSAKDIKKRTGETVDVSAQLNAAYREKQTLDSAVNKRAGISLSEQQASKALLEIDRTRQDAAVQTAQIKLDAAKRLLEYATAEGRQEALNSIKAAQNELAEQQRRLAEANRRAALDPLAEAASMAAQNAITEQANRDAEAEDDREQAAKKKQEHQEQAAADAAAISALHTAALQAIEEERKKRIAAMLQTPQQKRTTLAEARAARRAGRALDARARQHEIDERGHDHGPLIGPTLPGMDAWPLHEALKPHLDFRKMIPLPPPPPAGGGKDADMQTNNQLLGQIVSALSGIGVV